MTAEEDFIRRLDEHPDDWVCRLVFADWLEERADRRAMDVRVLGQLRRRPVMVVHAKKWGWSHSEYGPEWDSYRKKIPSSLPTEWWRVVYHNNPHWQFTSRQAAEDAAALAFTLLPAELQELLLCAEALA